MKTTLFCLMIFASACTTIQYHDPIVIPQTEVKNMKALNSHGNISNVGADKIKDCTFNYRFEDKACAQIICKRDQTQITGLSCLYYIPKNHDVTEYKTFENKFISYF